MIFNSLEEFLVANLKAYKAAADHAGVTFKCLDPAVEGEDALTRVEVKAEGEDLEARISGPIDGFFGFDARAFIKQLDDAAPKNIKLLIESPGGRLYDGLALYNDLRARARDGVKITAEARGLVASAATLPFLAADTRIMPEGTQLMVHNPWACMFSCGTAAELKSDAAKTVGALEASQNTLRDLYAARTTLSKTAVAAHLDAETWFSAAEAAEAKYATEVVADRGDEADEADEVAMAQARGILTAARLRYNSNNG